MGRQLVGSRRLPARAARPISTGGPAPRAAVSRCADLRRNDGGGATADGLQARPRFLLAYEPSATLRKVRCPLLALFGERDTKVPFASNRPALLAGFPRAEGPDATAVLAPGTDHTLQEVRNGPTGQFATGFVDLSLVGSNFTSLLRASAVNRQAKWMHPLSVQSARHCRQRWLRAAVGDLIWTRPPASALTRIPFRFPIRAYPLNPCNPCPIPQGVMHPQRGGSP